MRPDPVQCVIGSAAHVPLPGSLESMVSAAQRGEVVGRGGFATGRIVMIEGLNVVEVAAMSRLGAVGELTRDIAGPHQSRYRLARAIRV